MNKNNKKEICFRIAKRIKNFGVSINDCNFNISRLNIEKKETPDKKKID